MSVRSCATPRRRGSALFVCAIVCASVGATRPVVAPASAPATAPIFVFLHGDWRLSSQENASIETALSSVAKKLGKNMVPPASARPALERLHLGLTESGQQCGVASPGTDDELAALTAAGLGARSGQLREASWSIECSEKWGACAFGLVFRPTAAPDSSDEEDADQESAKASARPQPEFYSFRVTQAVAQKWKSADDLVRTLTASKKGDWKNAEDSEELASIFGAGGLGLLGGDLTGIVERKPDQPRAFVEIEREAGSASPLWSLLLERRWERARNSRTIGLDVGSLPCLEHPRLGTSTRAFARRGSKGWDVEIEDHDAELRNCLQPVVQLALASEDKAVKMLVLSVELRRSDIVTRDGRHIVALTAYHERTQDPDWRKQKPRVSDPALEDWLLPLDLNPFKQCLADFPFTDAYASKDHRLQTQLNFFYEVTFDALGRATSAKFLLPAKQGTPAEQIVEPARRCIERAALRSRAPCSAKGGTARAWLSVTTARVKGAQPASLPK